MASWHRFGSGAALAAIAFSCPLQAQTAAPGTDDNLPETAPAAGEEMIVVTGTRIRRPDFQVPNPVVTLDAETLQASGTTNLTDFLTGYPALIGSTTGGEASGDDADIGETGINLLNLRNLGTDRTLVLVDGRRHVSGLPGSQAVDINTIPTDLVERIDILTGGASAIYGADGVTGVVNFVLKRDFEGFTARGQAGISERGDAGQRFVTATAGHNFADGRGNFAIAYEYGKDDRFETSDRRRLRGREAVGFYLNPRDPENDPDYEGPDDNGIPDYVPLRDVRFFDTAREGGIDVDFDFFPDFLVGPGGNLVRYDPGIFVPDFYQRGGSGTLVSDYANDLLPRVERHVVNALGRYDLSDGLTLFAEAKYADIEAFSLGQPTFDYYLFVEPDNPFVPERLRATVAANEGALLTRDNFDLGQRGETIDRQTVRTVVGARGDISENLNYELSYVYGRTKVTNDYVNDIYDDRFFAAIDVVTDPATDKPTCRVNLDPDWRPNQPFIEFFPVRDLFPPRTFEPGECVPLNLFGEGRSSEAALDFIRVDTQDRSKIEQHVVSATLSGDFGRLFRLPGGDLGFALGAEYRKEKSSFVPDPIAARGLTFTNALGRDEGEFSVKEVFAELRAPILADRPFAERLDLGAAIRLSDYTTIGGTTTWKVDGSYAPVRDIALNATYSVAVRAPNIGELFGGRSQTFEFITDPCNFNQLQNGTQFRRQNCTTLLSSLGVQDPADFSDPRSTNLPGFSGGNPDLTEEAAKTWTAGVVFTPRFLRGFSLRADWYDIKLEDAVNTVEAEELAELCVDQASLDNVFCDSVVRQNGGANAGLITSFTVAPQNVARFATAGLDLNLNYRHDAGRLGKFNLNLVGNYLDKLEFIGTPGAPVTDERGEISAPQYQVTMDLSWQKGAFTLNYGLSWFDETLRFTNQETAGNPDILAPEHLRYKERWVHDLYGSIDVGENFQFYGGVNNLTDEKPDLGSDSYPVSAVGRFFFAGARVKLPGF